MKTIKQHLQHYTRTVKNPAFHLLFGLSPILVYFENKTLRPNYTQSGRPALTEEHPYM